MSQVAGQRRRAAEGVRHARRRDPAAVGRRDRLLGRAVDLRRDPEARGRELPPHPQHAALPARQHRRLRSRGSTRCRSPTGSRSTAMRSRAARAHGRRGRAPTTTATSSTRRRSGCRRSAPRTSAGSISTCSRTGSTPPARDSRARRSAQTALCADPRRPARADGADPVVHRRGGVDASLHPATRSVFCAGLARRCRRRRPTPRRSLAQVGRASAPCAARCRRRSRRCAQRAGSARRCRPRSRSRAAADDHRGAREPGRRPALRADHLGGAVATPGRRARRRRGRSPRRARTPSASAAGTTATDVGHDPRAPDAVRPLRRQPLRRRRTAPPRLSVAP